MKADGCVKWYGYAQVPVTTESSPRENTLSRIFTGDATLATQFLIVETL